MVGRWSEKAVYAAHSCRNLMPSWLSVISTSHPIWSQSTYLEPQPYLTMSQMQHVQHAAGPPPSKSAAAIPAMWHSSTVPVIVVYGLSVQILSSKNSQMCCQKLKCPILSLWSTIQQSRFLQFSRNGSMIPIGILFLWIESKAKHWRRLGLHYLGPRKSILQNRWQSIWNNCGVSNNLPCKVWMEVHCIPLGSL